MVVNPCIRFGWIDEHWSVSRRQASRVLIKEQMLEFRQKQHDLNPSGVASTHTGANRAAQAQHAGYMRLLSMSNTIKHASGSATSMSKQPVFAFTSLPPPPPLSKDELLLHHMAQVDAELLRWEQLEGYNYE
ncbi:hypothetical protein FS749_003406 [Ceratobasidium sp. UAMH 11750]|nr:hypothetical protein FS749_003406 [Ceratobasidium sp. UAMH 11750]